MSHVASQHDANRILSCDSVRNALSVLRMAFNIAIGDDMSAKNPCKGVELPAASTPRLACHDLRHTYATLSIAAGVELFILSWRMNHSSISITADRYGHPAQGNNQDADALDHLLVRAYKCYPQLTITRIPSSTMATKERNVRERIRKGETRCTNQKGGVDPRSTPPCLQNRPGLLLALLQDYI